MRQPQQATRIAGAQQERKIEIQPTKNGIIYICICIYITRPAHLEYGIEILASQGIPIIELENIYLEYS